MKEFIYFELKDQQVAFIIQTKALEAYQIFLQKILALLPIPINANVFQSPVIVNLIQKYFGLVKFWFNFFKKKLQQPIYGELNPKFINYLAPVSSNLNQL